MIFFKLIQEATLKFSAKLEQLSPLSGKELSIHLLNLAKNLFHWWEAPIG
jgi:hypothetical protein